MASFLTLYAAYAALGYRLVVRQHVIVGDAVARLAHAFFVFYGAPAKLVSIGFVWPPLMTAVLLPFASIKPLATSLVALPLTSALFAALIVVSLERILARLGCRLWLRIPIVGLFALNPMTVFYATNGMAELVYLCFLVLGTDAFLRWCIEEEPKYLITSSILLAAGVMTRYEVVFWFLLYGACIPLIMWRKNASRSAIEGTLVTFVVPTAFALTLWTYFNWLILGQSLYWIHNETPTFGEALSHAPHLTVSRIVTTLLSLNWHLFALTLPVGIALVVVGVVRRNLITVVVALTVLLNPVLTGVLVAKTGAPNLFQLRYNMRAMPLAIVGVAWLLYSYRSNLVRLSIGVSAIVLLAVSIPLTWNTMRTYPIQFDEQSFTRALLSGHSQEGTVSVVQYQIGIQHELDAASWIESRVHRPHRVLTDDAQSYDLMLLSGNPSLFLDRIDVGDARWHDVLNDPFGRVSYLLVSRIRRIDLVNERYPQLLKGGLPGFHLVYRNAHWSIFSVSSNPVRRGEAPAQPSK